MIETNEIVPENDVLIAVTNYFIQRGVFPYQFSLATGRGIDHSKANDWLQELYSSTGYTPSFSGTGADIIAGSNSEWWQVECKGSGTGKTQTQRTNFDRALASVVSYYEEKPPQRLPIFNGCSAYLGLALPSTKAYLKELRKRVRQPLRKRLNLWILLYDINKNNIRVINPEEDI